MGQQTKYQSMNRVVDPAKTYLLRVNNKTKEEGVKYDQS